MTHPSTRLQATKSSHLSGKKVVVGISGSIAAVETVRLVHELKRHGADVVVVMTRSARRFIRPLSLEFASGNPVVTALTGEAEHVALCDGRQGSGDVLLVAPATANTIAKMALGIDDSPVTSCATVALGARLPIVVAPAMHDVMHGSGAIKARLAELVARGVVFAEPLVAEEKAKLAAPEHIADLVIRSLAAGPWKGRRALVISGASAEPLDPIRVVTNRSSGRMGVELALALYRAGAETDLWNAWGRVALPAGPRTRRFQTLGDLVRMVKASGKRSYDAVFMPAALSDFAPVAARKKIHSDDGDVTIPMKRLPKAIRIVRTVHKKAVLVAFKAESEPKQLIDRARQRLKDYEADLVVANALLGFGGAETEVSLVDAAGTVRTAKGTKADVAATIIGAAAKSLNGTKGA